jgi:antitoxin component YwqK of YwqJK toxin-antitoxin module
LEKATHFKEFKKNFTGSSNLFLYINSPLTLRENQRHSKGKLQSFLRDNAAYLMSFSQLGISMTAGDGIFKSQMAVKYHPIEEIRYSTEFSKLSPGENKQGKGGAPPVPAHTFRDDEGMKIKPIHPENLDADEYIEYFSNGKLKRKVPLKNGLPHGTYREYYLNGKLKLKGKFDSGQRTGKWKYYDENGKIRIKKRY